MRGSLILVSGTGTDIGKTHVAVALLQRAAKEAEVCGFKPVESGVTEHEGTDGHRLSTFHVKRPVPPYRFQRAVSPHLAAREEGVEISLATLVASVDALRSSIAHVVVELAGGLFSPLAPGLLNVDLAIALSPTRLVLVAPDRLGVLHDLGAATRSLGALLAPVTGIVLSVPAHADASTGSNAPELALVTDLPLVATLPRAETDVLVAHPQIERLFRWAFERTSPQ